MGRVRALPITLLALGLLASSVADARPLTMRAAERAIDLAFFAELAGDADGGRQALVERLRDANDPEDLAARQRIESWLGTIETRQSAYAEHGKTALGYARAFATLEGFGLARADLLWSRAVRDVPGLKAKRLSLSLEIDRLAGLKTEKNLEERLTALIQRHDVFVKAGEPVRARLDFDATETKKVGRRTRVVCKSSFVIRDKRRVRPMIGAYSKRRTETRRKVPDARRMAVRRSLDDTAHGLVFFVRLAALEAKTGADGERSEL